LSDKRNHATSETPIRLIVGLANPGQEYSNTRHNAGAWFVEAIGQQQHILLRPETKFLGLYHKISLHGHECHLLIPTTYMNHSGASVAAIAKFYKIPVDAILVAHDELDLAPGNVKLKHAGGHAGHNGLRDIISALGSPNFLRLRLGIGHPGSPDKVTNYVLGAPNKSDRNAIDDAIYRALNITQELTAGHISKAMQHLHTTGN
jgi:PTH1 family peptidyl-tRNA hydrolase